MISYLFAPLLVCMYITGNMGFGLHTCDAEGSSKFLLMAGESPCRHHQHEEDDHHDDRCCHTFMFVLKDAQNSSVYVTIDPPEVLDIAPLRVSMDIPDLSVFSPPAFHAAGIVRGPDGGMDSVAPLRL